MSSQFGIDNTVTDGLIFCLDTMNSKCFNVTGSTLFDMGSANLDMVNSKAVTVGRDGVCENFSGGISTPGHLYNSSSISLMSDYTVDVWCYPTATSGDYGLVTWGNDSEGSYKRRGVILWANKIRHSTNGSNPYHADITANNWYHYSVALQSNGTVTMVQNGQSQTVVGSNTLATGSHNTFRIGAGEVATNWPGRIGPVRIYNRVLTTSESLQNYNAMAHRFDGHSGSGA